jgi:hypothetical protein
MFAFAIKEIGANQR